MVPPSSVEEWTLCYANVLEFARRRVRRSAALRELTTAEDLVQEAFALALSGTRRYPGTVDYPCFLRGIVRSLTSNTTKCAERRGRRYFFMRRDPRFAPSAEDLLESAQDSVAVSSDLAACSTDDRRLAELGAAVLEGATKRCDLAEDLGWTPDEVSALRTKLQRRIRQHRKRAA